MSESGQALPPDSGQPAPATRGAGLQTLAVIVVAIAALYFGQDLLIPFAVAALLSFVLSPLITRLRRVGMARVPSVLLVVLFAFLVLGGIATLVGTQLVNLAHNLPTYQQNIETKIKAFQSAAPQSGVIGGISRMMRELRAEIAETEDAAPEVPVVRLQQPEPSLWEVFGSVGAPLIGPVGTAGLAVVLLIFMLLEREDLRDRLIRLIGGDLYVTTEAMDEVAQRVSRYLLMQLLVNATYGIPVGIGLYLIGVPNALLWGVLATLLRFIPYVGPVVAALFPIALAIAVDPGWSMVLWTLGLILVAELISNNMVEPWLYGSSTGMSALAVIVAAIFWTMLWGPIGLFLSTPLTVCLAVVGRYIPQLRFLDVLLGSAPALTLEQRFYQRMLAGDPEEALEVAEQYLEDHSLAQFYDEVGRPALRLAERDRQRRVLGFERRTLVTDSLLEVVEQLAEHEEDAQADGATRPLRPDWQGRPVICAAGRSRLDLAAATLIGKLIEARGVGVQVLPAEALGASRIGRLEAADTRLVLISYLGPGAITQARQAVRRLRRRLPHVRVAIGLWNGQLRPGQPEGGPPGLNADLLYTSFTQAVEDIAGLALEPVPEPADPSPLQTPGAG